MVSVTTIDQHRRKIIKNAVAGSLTLTAATGCTQEDVVDRQLVFTSLNQGLEEAERLVSKNVSSSDLTFSLPQTLIHCAQSIDYSTAGFPQMKSKLFRKTVGSAAFQVFAWRGRMTHNLLEEIPGALPASAHLSEEVSPEQALVQLQEAVVRFQSAGTPLQPHFAYGQLSRDDYELAHAMHLANHFSVIEV